MVAVTQKGADAKAFAALAEKAWSQTKRPLVLRSPDAAALTAAAAAVKGSRSVLCAATPAAAAAALARGQGERPRAGADRARTSTNWWRWPARSRRRASTTWSCNSQTCSLAEQFQTNSIARRAALKDNLKPLGYPTLRFVETGNLLDDTIEAVSEITKYGGICVLPAFDAAQMASLMTLRLNIYTDPQKPIQVEPKVYPIGEPKPDSPVFVTTNFSLTYFIVSGEIENSGISAWLVVPECEGMSVLTAWAAGKFSGATIAKFIKEIGFEQQVTRRDLVIPGYVAQISGELEENLPGWKVLVGPQEAGDLESFVKSRLK